MHDRSAKVVIQFLRTSLANGALAAADLQAMARADGLLSEHQQIRHAKAFKKAKKSLGIRSLRTGFGPRGEWVWVLPQQAAQFEIGSVTNSHLDTKEQKSTHDTKVSESRHAALESGGVVQQWIDGIQRLDDVRCPTTVPLVRWHLFLGDCHRFMTSSENWADRAAALGWNSLALFGCHRTRPLDHLGSAGLLWALNGGSLVQLHRDWALIEGREIGRSTCITAVLCRQRTSRCLGSGPVRRPMTEYALHRCPSALASYRNGAPMGSVARRP